MTLKYVEAFKKDIAWLGFQWDAELYASDYFEQLYDIAERLVKAGKAYVDSQNDEQIREASRHGGPPTVQEQSVPGLRECRREPSISCAGCARVNFDGAHVLRAKVDLAHPNMIMRDPLLLRIRHASHYRRGDAWCIYPLYDFAHPLLGRDRGDHAPRCARWSSRTTTTSTDGSVREAGFEKPP